MMRQVVICLYLIFDTFPATPNLCAYSEIGGMDLTDCKDTGSKTKLY